VTPETRQVLEIARDWRRAADHDIAAGPQSINRFLKLWIAFNALYAVRFDNVSGDRNQVRRFAGWQPAVAAHERGLASDGYREAVESIAAFGVFDFRRNDLLRPADSYPCDEVLNAVYQVRCNLFHGHKSPTDLRDLRLVQAAGTIVAWILDELLGVERIWAEVAA
jgi:hypothetical protein